MTTPNVTAHIHLRLHSTCPSTSTQTSPITVLNAHLATLPFIKNSKLPHLDHPLIHSAYITGITHSQPNLPFWKVHFQIHQYVCRDALIQHPLSQFANLYPLPHVDLDTKWSRLRFPFGLRERLLAYGRVASFMMQRGVDTQIVSWNRFILLHGPPGTGKTSLCKSLAHQLCIRQNKSGLLIQVNMQSLLSKYFSESSRNVMRLFENIRDICDNSSNDLVTILFDEIESLAASRAASVTACEPSDALRLVNALLNGLDSLHHLPNAFVLATSNLPRGVDSALLDRADILLYVGLPALEERLAILEETVEELVGKGVVQTGDLSPLAKIAHIAHGFSGRMMTKLPILALVLVFRVDSIPLPDFIDALNLAVNDMNTGRVSNN